MAAASRAGGVMPPFTHADDAYCLAMVLFQVLVDGAHPWTAGERFEVNGIKPDEEDNMLARRFPYADPATCFPPKIRLQTYQKLPLVVRLAFERAFLSATAPTPQEWVHILIQARIAVNLMSSGPLAQNLPYPVAAAR
jgi:DNA-binding helix-hairpin-helix protein with protein kinase domain